LDKTQILRAAEYLKDRSQSIVMIMHTSPDGDAVGSSLAFYDYLLNAGYSNIHVIAPNPYASFLHWIPHHDKVIIAEKEKEKAKDLISSASILFCLDFNGFSRVNHLEKVLRDSKGVKIMIDHHPGPESGFDLVFSDTDASSTAEMVYEFIAGLGDTEKISLQAAQCLYVGIITDTGSFSYGCNNPRTYEIVARLIEKGVDGAHIHHLIYSTYTIDRMRLLGYCLSERLTVMPEYQVAFIALSKEDLKKFNHQEGDTEGVVNYALAIRDISLAVLFTEKNNYVKVSFRSVGDVDVNKLARNYYEGGGHKNAAGGKSFRSLEHTVTSFISLVKGSS